MKILFIGDISGRPGRLAVASLLPKIKGQHRIDAVFANAENAAGGSGLTPKIVRELLSYGIDMLTSGDHIWKRKEVLEIIDSELRVLRPANYPPGCPGRGSGQIKPKELDVKVGLVNLLGRTFIAPGLDCPFRAARRELEQLMKDTNVILVDIHAEATSEKIAMSHFLDGKVSAVVGTHTHVQTADEKILPGGTAYITDLGMTGPHYSVIGRRKEEILEHFLTGLPQRFEMADQDVQLQGAIIEIDEATGKALSIQRIQERVD
jgi:hypothetical protein